MKQARVNSKLRVDGSLVRWFAVSRRVVCVLFMGFESPSLCDSRSVVWALLLKQNAAPSRRERKIKAETYSGSENWRKCFGEKVDIRVY